MIARVLDVRSNDHADAGSAQRSEVALDRVPHIEQVVEEQDSGLPLDREPHATTSLALRESSATGQIAVCEGLGNIRQPLGARTDSAKPSKLLYPTG
jgi:hypothetical protein